MENRLTPRIALTGRLLTALENWRKLYFGSIANSGNGGDLNDYRKDGIVNLLKFAFGLSCPKWGFGHALALGHCVARRAA